MENRKQFSISPAMRYRDARAAIAFLERAFDFRVHVLYSDEPDGLVHHAELVYGDGMIMIGSVREGDDSSWRHPADVGGSTLGIYVVVDDADAHCARARDGGARITRPPGDTDYGSREYAALDPEGYRWTFGTYRPGGD